MAQSVSELEPGPTRVFGDYDQSGLDAQYDQGTLVPNVGDYMARWLAEGAAFRAAHPPRTLSYGHHERETVDLWVPEGAPVTALHVHLHGGAWRAFSRNGVSHLAAPLLDAGIAFAAVGFPLADDLGHAPLERMLTGVLAGFDAIARVDGIDPGTCELSLSGFSSGAHLAAMVLAERPRANVSLAMLLSGIYDLEPVRLSARNDYLHLDERSARRLSPIHRPYGTAAQIVIEFGDGELDEFQRQSRDFAGALRERGASVALRERGGANHFDVLDALLDPQGDVVAAIIAHHARGSRPKADTHSTHGDPR